MPKIGVYICHCGHNIAAAIEVEKVREAVAALPDVAVARTNVFCCAEPGQKEIQEDISEGGINRVVVAACSPRLHEATFRRTIQETGLNPYLLEIANIREQCSWVHTGPDATRKALELVRMALAKARLMEPLPDRLVPVTHSAMVVGGGVSGLQAALHLADATIPVVLVERQAELGGNVAKLGCTLPGDDPFSCFLDPLVTRVHLHPLIRTCLGHQLEELKGYVGNYSGILSGPNGRTEESVGAVIVAAGFSPYVPEPDRYPYAGLREVWTSFELEEAIRSGTPFPWEDRSRPAGTTPDGSGPASSSEATHLPKAALEHPGTESGADAGSLISQAPAGLHSGESLRGRRVAFIQCIGSRDPESYPHCSRICCAVTLKQALWLRSRGAMVTVYHRDIRLYHHDQEKDLFQAARRRGVLFQRGTVRNVIPADDDARITITASDEVLGEITSRTVDLVILAVGLRPRESSERMREVLRIPSSEDGFLLEAHPKLRPIETSMDGIYLAGSCQGPKDIRESVTSSLGAAAKAYQILAQDELHLDGLIAVVDAATCVGCGQCFEECPYQAIELYQDRDDRTKARVLAAACKGCGVCSGCCPTGSADLLGFREEALVAQIGEALAGAPDERKVLAFCCNWCAYAGADSAGVSRLRYPASVRVVRVPCTGRVNGRLVLAAFEAGAARVLVAGCHPPGDCHYISGNVRFAERLPRIRRRLKKRGYDPQHLVLSWISATEGPKFRSTIEELTAAADEEAKQKAAGAV